MIPCSILIYIENDRAVQGADDESMSELIKFLLKHKSCVEIYQYEPKKSAVEWLMNRQTNQLKIFDTVSFDKMEVRFNLQRMMFVNRDSFLHTSVDVKSVLVIVPPTQARINIVSNMIRYDSTIAQESIPYIDSSSWLVACSTNLLICSENEVEEWRESLSLACISSVKYNCLSTINDAVNHQVVIVTSGVINSSPAEPDANSGRYLRECYRFKTPFSHMPFDLHFLKWNRIIIDRCHEMKSHTIQSLRLWSNFNIYMTDIPESLTNVKEMLQIPPHENHFVENIVKNKSILYHNEIDNAHSFSVQLLKFKNTLELNNVKSCDWIPTHVLHSSAFHQQKKVKSLLANTVKDCSFLDEQISKYNKYEEVCNICLCNKSDCILTCGHIFCFKCVMRLPASLSINRFMNNKHIRIIRNCPICRIPFSQAFCRNTTIDRRTEKTLESCQKFIKEQKSVVILCQWHSPLVTLMTVLKRRNVSLSCESIPSKGECKLVLVEDDVIPFIKADVCIWMHFPVFSNEIMTIAGFRTSYYMSTQVILIIAHNSPESVKCQQLFEMDSQRELKVSLLPTLEEEFQHVFIP